jgi:hypothetical protein
MDAKGEAMDRKIGVNQKRLEAEMMAVQEKPELPERKWLT